MKNSTKRRIAWGMIAFFALGEFASEARLYLPQIGWWALPVAVFATCGWYMLVSWAFDNRKLV